MIRLTLIIAFSFCSGLLFANFNGYDPDFVPEDLKDPGQVYFELAEQYYEEENYTAAIKSYTQANEYLPKNLVICKKLALSHAALGQAGEAADFVEKYFLKEYKPAFLLDEGFKKVIDTPPFQKIMG